MNILLCNDDGYFSKGITILAEFLQKLNHKVTIVAPNKCCSGMGHASTFKKSIKVKKIDGLSYDCYSVMGTPSDCVMIGLSILKDNPPDFVLSGINDGLNLGTEISYSGTVNAAIEASIRDVRAIAISTEAKNEHDFVIAAKYFVKHLDFFLNLTEKNIPISININTKSIDKPCKFCTMGERKYYDYFTIEEGEDCRSYILDGLPIEPTFDEKTDVYNYGQGHTTITPLMLDYTHYKHLEYLQNLYGGEKHL